jgi:hypothetical protein
VPKVFPLSVPESGLVMRYLANHILKKKIELHLNGTGKKLLLLSLRIKKVCNFLKGGRIQLSKV